MNFLQKYILLIILTAVFVSAKSQGFITEEKEGIKLKPGANGIIKSNPLPLLWGPGWFTSEFRLVYEKPVNLNQSFLIGASYLGRSPFFIILQNPNSTTKITLRGFRFQLAYKFYLIDEAPEGFYIAPYFSYSDAYILEKYQPIYSSDYIKQTYMNINAIAGYQIIGYSGFAVDFYGGIGYKNNEWIEKTSAGSTNITSDFTMFDGPITHVKVILGFNIGYAF